MSEADIQEERQAAAQALQDAVERMSNAYARSASVVTDYIILVNTTWFTENGETAEGFNLYWPHDARTGFTTALGLLERGRRYIDKALDEGSDADA